MKELRRKLNQLVLRHAAELKARGCALEYGCDLCMEHFAAADCHEAAELGELGAALARQGLGI